MMRMGALLLYTLLFAPVYSFRAVILPGFGNDLIDYKNFSSALGKRGIQCTTVPIKRYEWLNIAKGVLSSKFWKSECIPDELFKFYYDKVDTTVREAVSSSETNDPIVLVCHSAGGWLARGLIGDNKWYGSSTPSSGLIAGIVTLGSPHFPPVLGSDMTRGALRHVNDNYPGAFLSEIAYVTVAGSVIKGNPGNPRRIVSALCSRLLLTWSLYCRCCQGYTREDRGRLVLYAQWIKVSSNR